MNRILSLAGALALVLGTFTACGDGGGPGGIGGQSYCDQLKETKSDLDAMEGGSYASFFDLADTMDELRDNAPDEIKEDWDTLVEGIEALVQAFEDAGLSEEDLKAIDEGEEPTAEQQQALMEAFAAMDEFSSEEFEAASDNIAKHAKEECDVDLDSEPTDSES